MIIIKNNFEFCLKLNNGEFRIHLTKLYNKKQSMFILFLFSFGIGVDQASFSDEKYFHFYFDGLRKYNPNRSAPGFKIKLK